MRDILNVEDGKSEREQLQRIFVDNGYSVEACENVSEAERVLRHESFRLALIDIGLSDKSGSYLFNVMKHGKNVSYIIILTGNPSVHLKQRFIDEGAIDYIVKGSLQAHKEALLQRVRDVIGDAQPDSVEALGLDEFLKRYVPATSRRLFLDMDDRCHACKSCGAREYLVSFAYQTQMPPEILGLVVCKHCATPMDPDLQ